nr:UPF0114 domain-containing protein [Ipomoea batatas]
MAATGRLLRTSRPCVGIGNSQSCYSFSGPKGSSARFVSKGGFGGEKGIGDGEKQPKSATKVVAAASARCLVTPEPKTEKGLLDLGLLLGKISTLMFQRLRKIAIRLPQKLHAQILMEKAIVDCRFFTWFAVAGSLLGSVLCFIEIWDIMATQRSESVYIPFLADMFLVGTAMLTFGIGLHVMFVGSNNPKEQMPPLPGSHLLPSLKSLPEKVGNEVSYAGKVENRACCGHDTPGWGAGKSSRNTIVTQLGSCLFSPHFVFVFVGLCLPSFQTQR